MLGEIILTSYTYDQGRVALNDAFSGTASFNGVGATTISGDTFYSAGTDLYNIFITTDISGGTSGNLWSSSTGSNSIIANNNTGNLASGALSIVGGKANSATTVGIYSFIGGGEGNLLTNIKSFIGGGQSNTSSGVYSTIGGGLSNTASGSFSFIGGGRQNTASNAKSTVVGGRQNTASGQYSFIGGGYLILASGTYSSTIGGYNNFSSAYASSIVGGTQNLASGIASTVIGGSINNTTGDFSIIIGGNNNTASGVSSTIVGGTGNTISGRNSIILGGGSITGSADDTTYIPNARLAEMSGTIIYSAGTDLYNIFAQTGNTFYNGDGTISGNRLVTTNGDIIWRRSPSSAGDNFKMLLWNDADSTSSSLYFKCEDHGPGSGDEFRYAKFGLIFSGTGSFGQGDMFMVMNNAGDSTSATTADAAIKISEDKSVTFYSAVTMNAFMDFTPQTTIPSPSIGRVFFSGSPLFRLMQNTGGTAADWCII